MIKALLLGCGSIGAGYDWNEPAKVLTHAKAYFSQKSVQLFIYDPDKDKARSVAKKYEGIALDSIEDADFASYQLLSIATPTTTHFDYLSKALTLNVPVIICEKPVVSECSHVDQLRKGYQASESRVLVNYMRRFQPEYQAAKQKILHLYNTQLLRGIAIKYTRGFLNNATHAIDLLQFLFEADCNFEHFHCIKADFDAFDYDPTISGGCVYLGCPLGFTGVSGVTYPLFEIDLFFSSAKVIISESGNEIRYYYHEQSKWNEALSETKNGLLDRYMVPVIQNALKLYSEGGEDNFLKSLELNRSVLYIIELCKKNFYATSRN